MSEVEREINDFDAVSYEKCIVSMISNFKDKTLLKRVYDLVEYLYIYKDKREDGVDE